MPSASNARARHRRHSFADFRQSADVAKILAAWASSLDRIAHTPLRGLKIDPAIVAPKRSGNPPAQQQCHRCPASEDRD
jgi:hypothetical protein